MNLFRKGTDLPFWLLLGWLAAAVMANRLFSSGIVSSQALYDSLQQGWNRVETREVTGILSVVAIRSAEWILLFLICGSRIRQAGVRLVLFLLGMSYGTFLVLATWRHGFLGILVFLMAGFPQDFFYMSVFGIMIYRYTCFHQARRFRFWGTIVLLYLAGIFSEIWISPWFLKIILNYFS